MKKGFIRPTVITLGIVIVLALLGFFYFGKKSSTQPPTNKPETVLKAMYDAQIDCYNANTHAEGATDRQQVCLDKTKIYTLTDNFISINCSSQNVPAKDQIKIDPATINGSNAQTVVHTIWSGNNQDTPADVQLQLINNEWKVVNIKCRPLSSSTSDETANWKTYTNDKYGFSINYPQDWKFATDNYINNWKDYLIFSIYKDQRQGARLELYKDFAGGFCEGSGKSDKATIDFNNNVKGEKTECAGAIAINFKKDQNNFWLIATFVNDDNRSLFNSMISTFKFTN